jgi:hypothetical protein
MAYRYQEEIGLHPIVKFSYLAMLLVFVVVGLRGEATGSSFLVLALVGVVLFSIPLLFGRLVIEVRETAVDVRFGYLGWPGRVIPLEDIEKTEAITYRPPSIRWVGYPVWPVSGTIHRLLFSVR